MSNFKKGDKLKLKNNTKHESWYNEDVYLILEIYPENASYYQGTLENIKTGEIDLWYLNIFELKKTNLSFEKSFEKFYNELKNN